MAFSFRNCLWQSIYIITSGYKEIITTHYQCRTTISFSFRNCLQQPIYIINSGYKKNYNHPLPIQPQFLYKLPQYLLGEADSDCTPQRSNEWQCSPSHQAPLICEYFQLHISWFSVELFFLICNIVQVISAGHLLFCATCCSHKH